MNASTKAIVLAVLSIAIVAAGAAKCALTGVAIDWTAVLGTITAAGAAIHASNSGPGGPPASPSAIPGR